MTLLTKRKKLKPELEEESSTVLTFTELLRKFGRQRPDHPWEREIKRVEKELQNIPRYKNFEHYMYEIRDIGISDLSHDPFVHGVRVGKLANVFRRKDKIMDFRPYGELMTVGGWLHDSMKLEKVNSWIDDGDRHEQIASGFAKKILPGLGYTPDEVNDIRFMIRNHTYSVKLTYKELLRNLKKETDNANLIKTTLLMIAGDRSEKLWREVGGIPSAAVYLTLAKDIRSDGGYKIDSDTLKSHMNVHFQRVENGINVISPDFRFARKSYRKFTKDLPKGIRAFEKMMSEYTTFMVTDYDMSYIKDLNKEIVRENLGTIPYLKKVFSNCFH